MNNLTVGEFTINALGDALSITADGSLLFSPAEAGRLIELVSLTLQAINLPAVPPKLSYSPFMVTFSPDGEMLLSRQTEPDKGLKFTSNTGDTLISAIDTGLKKHTDELKIRGGPRRGVSSYNPRDPAMDGR